jgi:hypothetical protein
VCGYCSFNVMYLSWDIREDGRLTGPVLSFVEAGWVDGCSVFGEILGNFPRQEDGSVEGCVGQ